MISTIQVSRYFLRAILPAAALLVLDGPVRAASASLQFVPVVPCRIMDTRDANGVLGGPFLAGGATRSVPIPLSPCGVPAAAAYALNIAVVPRSGTLGYLTVWPAGQPQPLVSTLNSPDGSILANAAIVPADAVGAINVFATDDTDLVIDINGYFTSPGSGTLQFYPLQPCRVLDTRDPDGPFGGPSIAGGTVRSFAIPSSGCGAPAGAAAFSFNVAVVPHESLGYLTVWPAGQPQPLVATLNSPDGSILANAAIVPAGTGGAVSFFATNTTDLVVDMNGYFAPPGSGGLTFHTVAPCRVVDTRNGPAPLGGPNLLGNTARTFPLPASSCDLPATAAAYSLNIAVVPSGPLGYLTAWPTGQIQPLASTLNAPKGLVVANAALVPSGAGGAIDIYALDTTDIVIDTNGYFGGLLTEDRTATFPAGARQLVVDNITNLAVGDLVTGRPATVNGLIVSAGSSTINVPKTAMVALGERVSGHDALSGSNLFSSGAVVTAISPFDSTSNSVLLNAPATGQSGNASIVFDAATLFPPGTFVVNPLPSAGLVNIGIPTTGASGPGIVDPKVPGSPGVIVRFAEPATVDRIATFSAGVNQINLDDTTGIAVGDLVTGIPSTVNHLIVGAGATTINVPKTASAAVGERATGRDLATGATLLAANTFVVAITEFNATSNTVTLNNPTLRGSGQASVTFDASVLIPAGTTVTSVVPSGSRITISSATTGYSGPGIVIAAPGAPGVVLRFTQR